MTSILEQQASYPAHRESLPRLRWDDPRLPVLTELEKRVEHLRGQLQDLMDTLARLAEQLPSTPTNSQLGNVTAPSAPSIRLDSAGLPVLRHAEGMGGQMATTALGLINDGANPVAIVLRATNLVSEDGDEIPSRLVSFVPNPLNVAGRAEQPVQVAVLVPSDARPGVYSGLVQAAGLAGTRAALVVEVK